VAGLVFKTSGTARERRSGGSIPLLYRPLLANADSPDAHTFVVTLVQAVENLGLEAPVVDWLRRPRPAWESLSGMVALSTLTSSTLSNLPHLDDWLHFADRQRHCHPEFTRR
jgi:hypothetical protein